MVISKRTGFTLIELLVVIAIIAILAAILFPVFAKARAKAHQASCLSNTKQTALSFLMYNSDYDGFFMTNNWNHYSPGEIGYWWHPVWPYIEPKMLDCPSTTQGNHDGWYSPAANDFNYNYSGTFEGCPCMGLAGTYDDFHSGGLVEPPANTARVPNPAEVIMFFETGFSEGYGSPYGWLSCMFTERFMVPNNHNNEAGGHFAFLDGHAKYMTTENCPPEDYTGAGVATWHGITFCRGYE